MIGEILDGKYELIRLLGEGGMGAVYEATHTGTGRRVAVKVISVHLLFKKDRESVRRFHREAKAAGAIDSPHITRVFDVGTEPETDAPYLVMEYLHGHDLDQLLQRTGPLPPEVVLRIGGQTCLGLQKAHEARVVHRDIKPANLFLTRGEDGEVTVKIVDFGIAKIRPDEGQAGQSSGLTRSGAMLGSPLYMSPEQARGSKEVDVRTDLWSLGITLYRALSGRAPHEGIDGFGDLITALCSKPPPPIQEVAPWVMPEIARVLHKALQFDPEQRYPSAEAMLEAIRLLSPGGFDLRVEQLVALTDDAREVVAPKLKLEQASIPGADTQQKHLVLGSTADPSISATAPTVSTLAGHQRSRTVVGLWVALGVALGAAGIYTAATLPAGAPIAAHKLAIMVPTGLGMATPARSAPPVAHTPDDLRRVKLAITPTDASVEINGTIAAFKDGTVELVGALGSIHRVRVFKGKNEIVQEVVVSGEGAMPAKLELKLTRAGRAGSAATPSRGPDPAASTPVPRPPPTAGENPLVPDAFQ